jgi:type IV secretory pathway TraG/TraD family ATPase VirD4
VLYLLIAQDLSQIEMKYSKANIETIVSTTAAKLILPLNNEQTAKRFASMVGKTTVRRRSTSHQSGYTKEAVNLSSNVSDSYEGVDLITTDLLMAMQPGTQIVLVQNFMNQPVSLEGIRYWDDPVISVRTHNIKNPAASVGPPPAPPMPEWMRLLRVAEHRRDSLEKAARAEAREKDRQANVLSTGAPHPPNRPPRLTSPDLRFQRHH